MTREFFLICHLPHIFVNEFFYFSPIILFFSSMSTSCFLLHSDNSTLNSVLRTVLTQEEIEEEAVLSANLKRNLANKALVCFFGCY